MKKLFALVLLVMALTSCTTINPGNVGIVVNKFGSNKGVSDFPATTGFVSYNPFSTTIFEYPTFMQTAKWTASLTEGQATNEEISFTNKDNMTISVDVSLSYSLEANKVPAFYVKFRNDDLEQFTHGYLRNITRDAFNETGGKYSIDQIMGDNSAFLAEVKAKVQSQVNDIGVQISQFGIIGAPRPPAQVTASINAKLQATQIAIQKENEVRQAQADAQKAIAEAEGQSQSMIKRAQGEAESNRLKASSLSPAILEWRKLDVEQQAITKWDGKQPTTVIGSGTNTLLTLPKQ